MNETIFNIALKSMARSVHHKIALEALTLIDKSQSDLFLKYVEDYLKAAKVPDDVFKDFQNHVYHVNQDWGGAPSSVKKYYDKLVESIKSGDWKNVIYHAGIMSHYFADIHHPFHTGQSEEETRVHQFTEFGAASAYQERIRPLLQNQLVPYPKDIVKFSKESAKPAFEKYNYMLQNFNLKNGSTSDWGPAYSDALIQAISPLISSAISGYATLLKMAFDEAKNPPPVVSLGLKAFIEELKIPIYWITRKLDTKEKEKISEAIEKEFKETGKVYNSLSLDNRTMFDTYKTLNSQTTVQAASQKVTAPVKESAKIASAATAKGAANAKVTAKFYLKNEDDVKDAPEIGDKTAESLKVIGIKTVKELIEADSEAVAKRLAKSYITRKIVQRWQTEARLNCTVPFTRGHDVRILYEVGITDVKDLKGFKAEDLLEKSIGAAKKLGDRVVNESSMPNLDEVKKWYV